jgi:8-oxo-dGTP diphosphatase
MIYEKVPHVTVGAIISKMINGRLNILLTKRNIEPFKDHWCLPGGHVDMNENVIDAVIREVKEETSLDFKPAFLGYQDEIFPELNIHNVVLLFYGEATGNFIADEKEVTEIQWTPVQQALSTKLAFHHKDAISLFLEKTGQ